METSYSYTFQGSNHVFQIGHHSGSLTAIIQPQGRPATPLHTLSTVPFPRDTHFVGRNNELHELGEKSGYPGSRAALVGLGGVGKSQIAIEYSYRVRHVSPDTWVFWVHVSNPDRFKQSLRDIADQVKIPGSRDPTTDILVLVQNWLRERRSEKWILILDNMDDDTLLRKPDAAQDQASSRASYATQPLLNFIPQSSNGSVIVTSRTKEVALRVVGHDDIILVGPMVNSDAIELLHQKLGYQEENPEAYQMVHQLDFMPLAISQAAGYIINRAPRCTILQYLERLKRSDQDAIRLLDPSTSGSSSGWEAGILSRDWEAENLILRTWMISFEHIRKARLSAADLLSLMSLFDRQAIAEALLRGTQKDASKDPSDEKEDSLFETDTDQDFEYDITTLVNYSFITIVGDGAQFTMHRLVQLSVRRWLEAKGQTEHWKEKFIDILYQPHSLGFKYGSWAVFDSCYPHIKSALEQPPESKECSIKWASLLHRGAIYANAAGAVNDGSKLILESRNRRATVLGEEHEKTLQSAVELASVYSQMGFLDEAEKLQTQLMETHKVNFGEDHPDAMANMGNLSHTLLEQGRFVESKRIQEQLLETEQTKFGGHPLTFRAMCNLPRNAWSKDRLAKGESLARTNLELRKVQLGEAHPTTLRTVKNLASLLASQGQLEEAEKLQRQTLELLITNFGWEYIDTLRTMRSLASTFQRQDKFDEAEQLQRHALDLSTIKLGEMHPDTIKHMEKLIVICRRNGQLDEVEKLQRQALEVFNTRVGEDHHYTLSAMRDLASTLSEQGRLNEVEKLQRRALELLNMKFGKDHPTTLDAMGDLASTISRLLDEAGERALEEQNAYSTPG